MSSFRALSELFRKMIYEREVNFEQYSLTMAYSSTEKGVNILPVSKMLTGSAFPRCDGSTYL